MGPNAAGASLAMRKDMRLQRDGASPSSNPCGERETKSAGILPADFSFVRRLLSLWPQLNRSAKRSMGGLMFPNEAIHLYDWTYTSKLSWGDFRQAKQFERSIRFAID